MNFAKQLARLTGGAERLRVAATFSFLVQGITRLSTFLLAILLARHLSPEVYGVYVLVLALLNVLLVFAEFGLPTLTLRESASQARLSASVFGSIKLSVTLSVLVASVALAAVFGLGQVEHGSYWAYVFMLASIPVLAVTKIIGHALRGLMKSIAAQCLDTMALPLVLLLLVGVLIYSGFGIEDANWLLGYRLFVAVIALIGIVAFLLLNHAHSGAEKSNEPDLTTLGSRLRLGIPFFLLAIFNVLNAQADILLVGFFLEASDVAIYRVGVQLASIVVFATTVVSSVFAPRYAALYSKGDYQGLQQLATRCAKLLFYSALPIVIVVGWWAEEILVAVFGSPYGDAAPALRWLLLAQLISASVGSPGFLLTMSGFENISLKIVGIAAALNIILNLFLVPSYGILGAAIATVVSLGFWNIAMSYQAKRVLNIDSSLISLLRKPSLE